MKLEDVVRQALSLGSDAAVSDSDGPGTLPGWNSMGHVRVLSAVEAAYGLRLDARDITKIRRLSDIKEVLRERGKTL